MNTTDTVQGKLTEPKPSTGTQVRGLLSCDDPLAYLPCAPVLTYNTGDLIYTEHQPATNLYLVLDGKVKVSRRTDSSEIVMNVYQADEFFGESSLANSPRRDEAAVALEHTWLMSWSADQIEETAATRPQLALALLQLIVRRSVDFETRIESFSIETITQRLTRALILFADRFGSAEPDGSIRMTALTHDFLSRYVGTSREIVTQHMSQFRREGYLDYSRSAICLHPKALAEWRRYGTESGLKPGLL